MNRLCLFDLDQTLLPIDSDHAWGNYMVRMGWVEEEDFRRRNDEFFAQYDAGELDIHAYVAFATAPLRDRSAEALNLAQTSFMLEVIAPQLKPAAIDLVHAHQEQGDLIALVTATNDFVTAPIAAALGIEHLIATCLERGPGGTITGRIHGTPSYRKGKVVRVEQWLTTLGREWMSFDSISVYSDSLNDLALLELAHHPVATNPTPALAALAQGRGWRILRLFDDQEIHR